MTRVTMPCPRPARHLMRARRLDRSFLCRRTSLTRPQPASHTGHTTRRRPRSAADPAQSRTPACSHSSCLPPHRPTARTRSLQSPRDETEIPGVQQVGLVRRQHLTAQVRAPCSARAWTVCRLGEIHTEPRFLSSDYIFRSRLPRRPRLTSNSRRKHGTSALDRPNKACSEVSVIKFFFAVLVLNVCLQRSVRSEVNLSSAPACCSCIDVTLVARSERSP